MPYLALGLRVLIAAVLAAAVAVKLRPAAYAALARSVRQLGLPHRAAQPAAAAVLAAEALIAAGLWWSPARTTSAVLAMLLFGGYTAAVARSLRRDLRITCACFGGTGQEFGRRHLVRNLLLTALAAAAWATTATAPAADPALTALAVFAGLLLAAVVAFWEDLATVVTGAEPAPIERTIP